MRKEDMLMAIRVYEAVEKLNKTVSEISGATGLHSSKFKDIFLIADLIYRNCNFYKAENDEAYQKFVGIMMTDGLSPEEKYAMLVIKE